MSGGFRGTPESFQRWAEIQRRIADLFNAGMPYDEAYMNATCEREWHERSAEEQRKLSDIRENGT